MTVKQLQEKLNLQYICNEALAEEKNVTGCYCGDLLSWVMSKATEGDAWLTVMGNVTSRRGNITGTDDRNGSKIINADIPLSEMFGYATDLRSRTQGRGNYTMQFSHYAQVPKSIAEKIVGNNAKND